MGNARRTSSYDTKADIPQKRLCCQFIGIIKKFCTMNFTKKPTINSNVYVQQLIDAVQEKQPEFGNRNVVFQHDNAKSPPSLVTCQKLLKLIWDLLSPPLYSPDLVPSAHHLFCFFVELLKKLIIFILLAGSTLYKLCSSTAISAPQTLKTNFIGYYKTAKS